MSESKTIKIDGVNIFGEARVYRFNLIDTETGLKIFHETDFVSLLVAAAELIKLTQETDDDGKPKIDGAGALIVGKMFTGLLTWEQAERLFKELLGGAEVHTPESFHKLGADGKVRFEGADASEQYIALAHALFANWPEYASFFEGAVEGSSRDGETDNDQGDE